MEVALKSIEERVQEIEKLRLNLLSGRSGGAPEKTGRLSARDRLGKLLDHGTFREIEMFSSPVKLGLTTHSVRGDGVISGYGKVNNRTVCVWAQDSDVLEGRVGVVHGAKIVRLTERALRARVPCIGIMDSEGIRIEEMISTPTNYSYDRLAYVQTMASGVIPQISLVMGPCLGASAICAQLADFVFMVRGTSYSSVYSAKKDDESFKLGTAEVHYTRSGCCDVLEDSEEECIDKARELLNFLPLNNSGEIPVVASGDDPEREVPELFEIVPADSKKPYCIKDVIIRIVDNSQFIEIKGGWATNLVVGFGRFGGSSAGIIGNNPQVLGGCLDVDAADKLSRFVRFCDAFNIPIIYLADTPAFLPGKEQEQRGIIRHGSKVVYSNSEATVPQIQIYLRKCYGGGNLAMPGNNLGGDFGLAWPSAEVLLMHPEGAVSIIYRKDIEVAKDPKAEFERKLGEFKDSGSVEKMWEALTVQDYINPKDTRSKIVQALEVLQGKTIETHWKRHDNMPL